MHAAAVLIARPWFSNKSIFEDSIKIEFKLDCASPMTLFILSVDVIFRLDIKLLIVILQKSGLFISIEDSWRG